MVEKVNIVQKQYYTIKVQVMVPGEITYKVFAESPEAALLEFESKRYSGTKQAFWNKLKKLKAMIYKVGTINLLLEKKYR